MNNLTAKLIEIIDDTYLFEAGPMGRIICDEIQEQWKKADIPLHHLTLTNYIDALANELPDKDNRKAFAERLLKSTEIQQQTVIKVHLKAFL